MFSVVQRHSFTTNEDFSPTAPSVPYDDVDEFDTVTAGTQGLKGEYFPNIDLSGDPTITRLDAAANFHFFALGPDWKKMPSAVFSTRWTGAITPDADVDGARFNLLIRGGPVGDCGDGGARLVVDGKLVANMWCRGDVPASGNFTTISDPVDLRRGEPVSIVLE